MSTTTNLSHAASLTGKDAQSEFLRSVGIDEKCIRILMDEYNWGTAAQISTTTPVAGDKYLYANLQWTFMEKQTIESVDHYVLVCENLYEAKEFGEINNYKTSSIRKELNEFNRTSGYHTSRLFGGISTNDLYPHSIDLETQDGMNNYNTDDVGTDYISPIGLMEYRKYRDYVEPIEKYNLMTAYSAIPSGIGVVCSVNKDGTIGVNNCKQKANYKVVIHLKGTVQVQKAVNESEE